MLSKGLGVYHMANQNTSIGKYPEDAGALQTLAAVCRDFSIRIAFMARTEWNLYSRLRGLVRLWDLEWHKEKKHRPRRHLSLLLKGLAGH